MKHYVYVAGTPEKNCKVTPSWRFRLANWILKGQLFDNINELIFYDFDRLTKPQETLIKEIKNKGSVTINVEKKPDGTMHSKDPFYILMVGKARDVELDVTKRLTRLFYL